MDHQAENLQKIRVSDLPEEINADVEDIISRDFNETMMELEILFSVEERAVFHRLTYTLENLELFEDNIREVDLCYKNVAERLTLN